MYSNDTSEIRAGLVNYLGALLTASKYDEDRVKKQSVVAVVEEEIRTLCKDNNGYYELYACKPIFRLCCGICNQQINILKSKPQTVEVQEQLRMYSQLVSNLEMVIESIK